MHSCYHCGKKSCMKGDCDQFHFYDFAVCTECKANVCQSSSSEEYWDDSDEDEEDGSGDEKEDGSDDGVMMMKIVQLPSHSCHFINTQDVKKKMARAVMITRVVMGKRKSNVTMVQIVPLLSHSDDMQDVQLVE